MRLNRGVATLTIVGTSVAGIVWFVHRLQTNERKTMREAVLRDIERLGK